MREFSITKKYENAKIENVLLKQFPNISISTLNKLFRVKDVKVNDCRISKGYIVSINDNVKVYAKDDILFGVSNNVDIYYEDDNILVAYKPKGIVSCDSSSNDNVSFECLVRKIKDNNNLKICHRLDTNTEGLVIFSKNELAQNEILNTFKSSLIHKEYLTLVYGKMEKQKDTLKAYIQKDVKDSFCKVKDKKEKGALEICTEYEVVKYFTETNTSLLNIKLHTGRTHQIRAHMKHIGHNVIGDSKYGINEINRKLGFKSQILIAYRYTFSFDKDSSLFYLNNKIIEVNKEKIDNILKWIK